MLMTTLSSHLARPQTSDSSRIAKSWSLRALQIADGAMKDASRDSSLSEGDRNGLTVCARAKSVGAYNLGMMAEVSRVSGVRSEEYGVMDYGIAEWRIERECFKSDSIVKHDSHCSLLSAWILSFLVSIGLDCIT